MPRYIVTIGTKHPVAGQRDDEREVTAPNKRAACKEVREDVKRERAGDMSEPGNRLTFTARLDE